jgi:hypothetical protein
MLEHIPLYITLPTGATITSLIYRYRKDLWSLIKSLVSKKKNFSLPNGGLHINSSNSGGTTNINIFIVSDPNMINLLNQQKKSGND